MALTLEVTYADRAALRHALESQLARGGLYVAVDASRLPPLCELTLRVCADAFVAEAPSRLTVATAAAACVEIAAGALAGLVAAVGAYAADAVAQAGVASARIVDSAQLAAEAGARDGGSGGALHGANDVALDGAGHGANDDALDGASDGGFDSAFDSASDGATHGDGAAEKGASDTRGVMSLDRKIAVMAVGEKIQLALHGNREARQLLMRDRAGIVQSSLVRNPKMTLEEVQALARAPQLAPDTAELLAVHPIYGVSPQIAMALVRNPRTPLPTATQLIAKLSPNDLRAVAKGLGVRSQVAAAARKRLVDR